MVVGRTDEQTDTVTECDYGHMTVTEWLRSDDDHWVDYGYMTVTECDYGQMTVSECDFDQMKVTELLRSDDGYRV